MFPADNPWNKLVNTLKVRSNSSTLIKNISSPARPRSTPTSAATAPTAFRPRSCRRPTRSGPSVTPPMATRAVPAERDVPPLRTRPGVLARQSVRRRRRRELELEVERVAAVALDIRRRGRAADPARTRALRRSCERKHQPCVALRGPEDETGVHPAGHALRVVEHEQFVAADGIAPAPKASFSLAGRVPGSAFEAVDTGPPRS